jgi:site-specific DNA-cytosine methylase
MFADGPRIGSLFSGYGGLDLAVALRELNTAVRIEWINGVDGHDLEYQEPDGHVWRLKVTRAPGAQR